MPLQRLELLVDIGSRAEVHGPYQVVKPVVEVVGRPVALEERDILAEILAEHVPDGRDVRFVGAIRTIFILDLHHDYGSSMCYGEIPHLPGQLLLEPVHTLKEKRVPLPESDVLLFEQPPRKSAHFPLGTDVRPGAQYDFHVVPGAELHKSAQVILPAEVETVLPRLM